MPIGYPLPVPVTIPNDVADGGHGWPILDATGWTTTLIPETACEDCAQDCGAYQAAAYMLDAFAADPESVAATDFGPYNPAIAQGFIRAFHRYLYLLESLAWGGKLGRAINSYDNRLANFAEDWPFEVVSVSGTAVTISWTLAGELNDPRNLALTGGGGFTSLQPWDIAVEALGGYDRGPWAIVTSVEHGATNTTVNLHKAIGVSAGDVITFCGDRVEPVQFARPEPWTIAARCVNCRMDPTGSLQTVVPADPGAPSTQYASTYWYCRAMRYASRVADFLPGVCAYTDCSQYAAAPDWRAVPSSAIHALWNAMGAVLFTNTKWGLPYARMHRVGHPSILSLCAAFQRVALEYNPTSKEFEYVNKDVGVSELYRAQEKASLETEGVYMPNVTWSPTPSFGRMVSGAVVRGLFREDATGVVQAATPRYNGWGEAEQYAPETPTTDVDLSMRNHPLRRFPSVRTNSESAYRASWIQGTAQSFPGEFFVQRALPRSRVYTALDPEVTDPVEHEHGTTTFDGDTLTVEMSRPRTWTKRHVGGPLNGADFTGVVVTAYAPDDDGLVRLDIRPAVETWHYTAFEQIAGKNVLMDQTEPLICAGNFVDAPQWQRANNVFNMPRRKRTGCVFDSCQEGDTVDWTGVGGTQRAYVMRAAAHYGPEWSGSLFWEGAVVSSGTAPIVEVEIEMQEMIIQTGYFWMDGVPSDWKDVDEPVDGTADNETGVRLKMDSIWIEVPAGVDAPIAGDVLTVGQNGIMAPPSIKPDVTIEIVNPVTGVTSEVTEYDLDPALGVITIEDWTAAAGNCLRVSGWFLEAENRMQAETLLETRKALRRMDGYTLSIPVTAVSLSAQYAGGTPGALPDFDLLGNEPNPPAGALTIVSTESTESAGLALGFVGINIGQAIGPNFGQPGFPRALANDPNYTTPGFDLGNVAQVMGLLPEWIAGAWIDVYVDGTIQEIRRTTTLTGTTASAATTAKISAHLIVVSEDGSVEYSSGGSVGVTANTGWQTIAITNALKALCDTRKAAAGSKLYLAIGGEWDGSLYDGTRPDLERLVSPFVESITYTIDPENSGALTAFNASYTNFYSPTGVAFVAQNMRLQLSWNDIEATDLPDLPYDTWPALVE